MKIKPNPFEPPKITIPEKTPRKKPSKRGLNLGLLIIRIGVGIEFILHGIIKLQAGSDEWREMGSTLLIYGIHFAPMILGFLAIFPTLVGGTLLILGVFMRTVCFLLLAISAITLGKHITLNDSFLISSHAMESAILFLSLLFIGPGKYTLSEWLLQKR